MIEQSMTECKAVNGFDLCMFLLQRGVGGQQIEQDFMFLFHVLCRIE